MSLLHRVIQPAATAVIAIALLLVTVYFRPVVPSDVGYARTMEPEGSVEMLPRASQQPQVPYDDSFDTLVLTVWLSGLFLILIGSLYLIWSRARAAPGRHRSAT